MPITERVEFPTAEGGAQTLHVEVNGAVVNITVGLRDQYDRKVTRVDISPDDESRGGDGEGYFWRHTAGDARIVRDERCRHCAASITQTGHGWIHRQPPSVHCDDAGATSAQPEEAP